MMCTIRDINAAYKSVGNIKRIHVGLGKRLVFYPNSSVDNTSTFDVVEDTGSYPISSVSFVETLARASLKKHISLVRQVLKRIGQVSVRRYMVPTPPRSRRSEGGRVL